MSNAFQIASARLREGPVRRILDREMDGRGDPRLLRHLLEAGYGMVKARLGHGGCSEPDMGPLYNHFRGRPACVVRIEAGLKDAVNTIMDGIETAVLRNTSAYLRSGPIYRILAHEMDGKPDQGLLDQLFQAADDMVKARLRRGGRLEPDMGPFYTHFRKTPARADRIKAGLGETVEQAFQLHL